MTNLLEELAREWYACVQIIEAELAIRTGEWRADTWPAGRARCDGGVAAVRTGAYRKQCSSEQI